MKKIIAFTIIAGLCSSILFGNNRNADPRATYYLDTIPRNTDTSYGQKQIAFHQETAVVPHFDTLNANSVYKQMDSVSKAKKLKTDSMQMKKKTRLVKNN
jgi:hypothetical protein